MQITEPAKRQRVHFITEWCPWRHSLQSLPRGSGWDQQGFRVWGNKIIYKRIVCFLWWVDSSCWLFQTDYSDHGLATIKLNCRFSEATLLHSHLCLDSILGSTQHIIYDSTRLQSHLEQSCSYKSINWLPVVPKHHLKKKSQSLIDVAKEQREFQFMPSIHLNTFFFG